MVSSLKWRKMPIPTRPLQELDVDMNTQCHAWPVVNAQELVVMVRWL